MPQQASLPLVETAQPPAPRAVPSPGGVWSALGSALNPGAARPRIRMAVVEVAHHTARNGAPYAVLRNRVEGTYVKVGPRELDLLPLMDGTRTVSDLVVQYFLRHKVLAFPRVAGLVRQLREQRFLVETPVDAYASLRQRLAPSQGSEAWLRRAARWLFGREVVLENLDDLVARWHRQWGWLLFTPAAQWAFGALAVLGVLAFALTLPQSSQRLFRVGDSYLVGFLALLGLSLASTAVHELGHALTLKHVGRHVRRGGFLVYYGIPTFFVDTSDVWMAGPRARLAVSFAGPYTALISGGIASLGALATGGTLVGDLLLTLALVSYLDVLFNLNPLLELDGYYLLVDALERPMLRQDALRFVRRPLWARLRARQPLTPDERLLAGFGLLSAVWTAVSIWLALYLWETRMAGVVRELWRSEHPLARLVVLLGGTVLLYAIFLVGRMLLRSLTPWVVTHSTLLARRGQALRRRDALRILRELPFLRDLPEARLVELAVLTRPLSVPAGRAVVWQGEPGATFYLVRRGTLEVLKDGQPVASIGANGYFGEIALLRNVPRTATVVARTAADLLTMNGADFRTLLAHELETFQRFAEGVEERSELAQLPLLAGLGPAELDLLWFKLERRQFQPGECIMEEGALGDRFHVVRRGSVAVEAMGQRVAVLGPGDYVGEIALLLDRPRTATVRVSGETPAETWSLSQGDFADILARYLGLGGTLRNVSEQRLRALPPLPATSAAFDSVAVPT